MIDVKITHGRDRSQLEDHRGEASLRVKNVSEESLTVYYDDNHPKLFKINYRNNIAYGWWSEKLFNNIPIV